mgnify:FL=1
MVMFTCSCVLCGQDVSAQGYISEYANKSMSAVAGAPGAATGQGSASAPAPAAGDAFDDVADFGLRRFVVTGRKANMPEAVSKLLETCDAMEVINGHLIPALDDVGERFEKGKFFLPQLMASAEAAKAGFDVIKEQGGSGAVADKGSVAIATVKGDIHDIGKNIVKVLLENYSFDVIDLGKDVPPEVIVDTAVEQDIRLVGLSALMTTTVVSMEETIKLLRERKPECKVMVGGAVLNQDYADMIGADFYGKDAMQSVYYAQRVFGEE